MSTIDSTPQPVSYELDEYNNRIKLVQYDMRYVESLIKHLEELAQENDIGKVIIYAHKDDIPYFRKLDFEQEGEITGFFDGDPACILSRFLNNTRSISKQEDKKDLIVELAKKTDTLEIPPLLDASFQLRHAKIDDAKELATLYNQIFETYPTPIHNEEFIKNCMDQNVLFTVITQEERIVSAASADLFPNYNSAEITDCATKPAYRGKGLLSAIIFDLEKRVKKEGILNLFSLTRAVSKGMNIAMSKLGFEYKGRLIQNSQMNGKFEDMNIWVKNLSL